MLKDAYGNGLSTTSADARDAYDLGVRRFLGAEPGVEAAFNAASRPMRISRSPISGLHGNCSSAPNVTG
ncbi:MAG: hypothetical protein CM15mP115_19700 [Alphaproteobacteria bacterium]|nr:MAG: hypothetical protein CM15mP115_19700 [Alphaproteobacteria bacterium]